MSKKIAIVLFIILSGFIVNAQEINKSWEDFGVVKIGTIANSSENGVVNVSTDGRLETILKNYASAFSQKTDKVFRVQIYLGTGTSGRNEAQGTKSRFETMFPGYSTYLVFEEPYFKVKVGDFKTKIEAESLRMKIQKDFSKAFIIEE